MHYTPERAHTRTHRQLARAHTAVRILSKPKPPNLNPKHLMLTAVSLACSLPLQVYRRASSPLPGAAVDVLMKWGVR